MMRGIAKFIFTIVVILMMVFFDSCVRTENKYHHKKILNEGIPLERIISRGVLRVITDYNSTAYFIYKGHPMGFHYDILKEFADHLGVILDIKIPTDNTQMFTSLLSNECDLIALDLAVTDARKEYFNFSLPVMTTRQVLVQRKQGEAQVIRELNELHGLEIHVQKNSSFSARLKHIQQELNIFINIVEEESYRDEDLFRMVAEGKIDYTVVDEHTAKVNHTYYPNIDISTGICFKQDLAWALNKNSIELQQELNEWLSDFKKTKKFKYLYTKYFENPRYRNIVSNEFFTLRSGKISPYDDLIKKHAKTIDWDWQLLASLIFQESQFNANLTSWAGAYGIMQLMPETAAHFGVDSNSSVDEHIRAGVLFIRYLDKVFSYVEDKEERIKFILASYNSGPGHVLDAMRLADKFGKDSKKWTGNTDSFMLYKSNPKYYHLAEVKNGYSRGIESFKFVTETLERYQHYKNAIK